MKTGKLVRKLRNESGLTQQELADKAGLHHTTVSHIERGKIEFGYKSLMKICKALKIQFHYFIFLSSEKKERFYMSRDKVKHYNAATAKGGHQLRKVV
jgi:transcriptional regulator with XRE-family HTH domain